MWYYITAFVMWLLEGIEDMVGEKAAPYVLYTILFLILFFGGRWLGSLFL
jgi:hypothetical protein